MSRNRLEKKLDEYCKFLNAKGIHCHKNHPFRLHDGTYIKGEPFDYEIMTNPVKVFDAKEVSDNYLRIGTKERMQLKALLDCQKSGHDAFFLIWFSKYRKLKRISADNCNELLKKQKTIHYTNCEEVSDLNDI